MKSGMTLDHLMGTVARHEEVKKDYRVYPADVRVLPVSSGIEWVIDGVGAFEISNTAHTQIASRLEIPLRYYRKCLLESPELLALNVNHWLKQQTEPKLVRTLGGTVRAYLTSRYRMMDNAELLNTVMPILREVDGLTVESCFVNEDQLYLKALTPKKLDLKVGDTVQYGVVISNNEVGQGSVKVEPLIYRLVCSNGLIARDHGITRRHTGKVDSLLDEEGVQGGIYSEATLQADEDVVWMKVKDHLRSMLSDRVFSQITDRFRQSMSVPLQRGGEPLDKAVNRGVEEVTKRCTLSEEERSMTLMHLYQGGDFTRFGLVNAVTRMSQDVESYQRATELEALGYEVLMMK